MDAQTSLRVMRLKMWEEGHSFDEIDRMSMADFGDVIAYWSENARADEARSKRRDRLSRRKSG